MTTIAYRDGIMAADSQCTDEWGMKLTDTDKIFRLHGGGLLGTAGDDDARELMELLDSSVTEATLPTREQLGDTHTEFLGLLWLPDDTLWYVSISIRSDEYDAGWDGSVSRLKRPFAAVGSGQQFAYGAMAHGATAKEAIKVAAGFDIYTALPVQFERISA